MGSCPDTDIDPKCAFFFLSYLKSFFLYPFLTILQLFILSVENYFV